MRRGGAVVMTRDGAGAWVLRRSVVGGRSASLARGPGGFAVVGPFAVGGE